MDLFIKYLRKDTLCWVKRALTDTSFKNVDHELSGIDTNSELATYGDSIIKYCLCELLLDKVENITVEKQKYEPDKFFVEKVAKHYGLIRFIRKDDSNENLATTYEYDKYGSKNGNRAKYIATAVEAMIGAIYKETNDLKSIIELVDSWRYF